MAKPQYPRHDPERCSEIRQLIKKWDDQWRQNHLQYYEFNDFVLGNQWKEEESRLFERYNKIPLTSNKLAPLANYLGGEQRQNTPSLEAIAIGEVDEQTLEVRNALIKEITFNSNTEVIYQNSFQKAAVAGFGAWWLGTEYSDNESFDQDIKVYEIRDPCKAYWDLSAQHICKVDGMHAGFKVKVSREKFRQLNGKEIEASIGSSALADGAIAFCDDDSITVIHHFWRDIKKYKIYELSDDETVTEQEKKKLKTIEIDGDKYLIHNGEPVTITNERTVYDSKIMYGQYAGDYELDVTEAKTKELLPVVYVDQNSYYDRDEKQCTRPFLKDARDAQRYINYLFTQMAYLIKISRYDQFLVSKKNVQSPDTQTIWRDPQNVQGGLIYDESPSGAKPEQLRPPEISQSLVIQYQQALRDIQSSTGIYGTQLGDQGNEISGDAINARNRRSAFSTFIPFSALNRAIHCTGDIVNEMIFEVFDSARLVKLTMTDQNVKDIMLNNPADDYGAKIENDMRVGKYKIKLVPGANFDGQKEEALASMDRVFSKNPQVFNLVADLYAENLPMPNNLQIRNRLRTLVPPEIVEAGKTGKPAQQKQQQPSPDQMAQMMDMKNKQAELQLKQQELQQKAQQSQVDMSIELKKMEEDRLALAAQVQEQEMRYSAEVHRANTDAQIAHAQNLVEILTRGEHHGDKPKRD